MAWIIIKAAGDDVTFTVLKIDGSVGHPYEEADRIAKNVTAAMKAAQQSVQRTGGESGQQNLFTAEHNSPAKVTRQSTRH